MISKVTLSITALCLVVGLASCQKGDTGPAGAAGATGPAGPAGPSYVGALVGHVSLFDQYGSRILTGLSSVQLTFNGNINVTPNATGYYQVNNVATGVYNIAASNTGFGNTKVNNFQFLKDTLNRDVKLSAIPDFAPLTITATATSIGDSIALTFNTDTRARACIVFINTGAAAGSTPDKYLIVFNKAIPANSTRPVGIIVPAQDLANAGIASGTTVNVTAYGYVVNDASAYEDLSTGKIVYTAVSTGSVTTTFTAP
ncbi:MAG: hypothetical protein EBZ77_14940 [Chitinophagia bacterium]|nr:hypothetical protein [Chitinophagia bacterium]